MLQALALIEMQATSEAKLKAAAEAAANQQLSAVQAAAAADSATTATKGDGVSPHIVARLPSVRAPDSGPGIALEPPPKYTDSNPEVRHLARS
jgi:hypothetical protein